MDLQKHFSPQQTTRIPPCYECRRDHARNRNFIQHHSGESCFFLKINFTELTGFHIKAQKYWILAVNAARTARKLELARGSRAKQARQQVNTKIPCRKKLGIVIIEQQIQRDGMHWSTTQTGTDPAHDSQSLINCFVTKQPHLASTVAALRSNKRLRKPRLTPPSAALIHYCVRDYTLSSLLAFWNNLGHSKLIPKGSGTLVPNQVAPLHSCCGKAPRQSKRLSSIIIVHCRIRGNLLSSLCIYLFCQYTPRSPHIVRVTQFTIKLCVGWRVVITNPMNCAQTKRMHHCPWCVDDAYFSAYGLVDNN